MLKYSYICSRRPISPLSPHRHSQQVEIHLLPLLTMLITIRINTCPKWTLRMMVRLEVPPPPWD